MGTLPPLGRRYEPDIDRVGHTCCGFWRDLTARSAHRATPLMTPMTAATPTINPAHSPTVFAQSGTDRRLALIGQGRDSALVG